jgi:ABC-type dipeptide/oligopeptide/nickel transport system permease subunit
MTAVALGKRAAATLRSHPSAWFGATLLLFVMATGLLAPLSHYDPITDVDPAMAQLPPGPGHWLGTDHLGRDVLKRLLLACQFFVIPGLLACAVASVIAIPAGAVAGYRGGWIEALVRWAFNVLASVPRFVLVLLVLSIYGDHLWLLALAAGAAYSPTLVEAVFARIEALRSQDYVVANRAYGVPGWRILWVHLVWAACRRLIGRHLLTLFGYFLVLETTLSYIGGFGVQEPMPSWGNMLVFEWGRDVWYAPQVIAPVIMLWLTIGAAALVAESLGEVRGG